MSYKFKLPIGDWSFDGHSKCDWFIIGSNKPVEDVREAYFRFVQHTGTGFDNTVKDAPYTRYDGDPLLTVKWMKKIGLENHPFIEDVDASNVSVIDDTVIDDTVIDDIGPDEFAQLFVDALNKFDSSLGLSIEWNDTDMFPFYGYDDQKRHIGHIGYGLLSS